MADGTAPGVLIGVSSGPAYGPAMDLGPGELAIILVIVLVLFGGAKLPQLARSLGQAKKEFESGQAPSTDSPTSSTPAAADRSSDQTT